MCCWVARMAEKLTPAQILEGLQGQFATLIAEFRILVSCFPIEGKIQQIPDAVAYEFQHAMIHLAFSSTTDSATVKKRSQQYRSAIEHFERSIMDGWKLLIFAPQIHAQVLSTATSRKQLIDCRLGEYREIAGLTIPPSENGPVFAHSSIKKYRTLYMTITGKPGTLLSQGAGLATNFDPQCFALLHTWGQYELILCSLLGKKDLAMLNMLIEAVLNNFTTIALQTCIGVLASAILRELLKLNTDFSQWIYTSHELHSELTQAEKGIRQSPRDYTLLREFFHQHVLSFHHISIRNFSATTQ